MSNMLTEIVKRTEIKPMAAKALMRHIADTVRDRGDWCFWESRKTTAAYLGTDRATVQRNMKHLEDAGLIFCQTERPVKGGYVNVYMVEVDALLRLPCVDETETRREYVKRLVEVEGYIHPADFPDADQAGKGAGENSEGAGENFKGAGENSEGAGETGTIPINPNRTLIEPLGARDLSDQSLSEKNPDVIPSPQRGDSDQRSADCLEEGEASNVTPLPIRGERSPDVSTHVSAHVSREGPQGVTRPQRSDPVLTAFEERERRKDRAQFDALMAAIRFKRPSGAPGQPDHTLGHQPDMRGDAPASAPNRSTASDRTRQAGVTSDHDRATASDHDREHNHQTGARHVIH